eukprot:361935-Chlamydomonas_euryale.AAC.20
MQAPSGGFGRPAVELDLDLLVSVSSDLGAIFVDEKGDRHYKRSADSIGEMSWDRRQQLGRQTTCPAMGCSPSGRMSKGCVPA